MRALNEKEQKKVCYCAVHEYLLFCVLHNHVLAF